MRKNDRGIRATYDQEADVLSIELQRPRTALGATEITPNHFLHLDPQGRLVTIEVLDASSHYGPWALKGFESPASWVTLAEASKASGLALTTLRTQIRAGKLKARKRARDWLVAEHELWNYMERRAPQGRRSAREKKRSARATAG